MDFPDVHNTNFLNMQFHDLEELVPPKKRRLCDGKSNSFRCDMSRSSERLFDIRTSRGILQQEDGSFYCGELSAGQFNGYGTLTVPSGNTIEGTFRCGLADGFCICTNPWAVECGTFLLGRREGIFESIQHSSKQRSIRIYENDMLVSEKLSDTENYELFESQKRSTRALREEYARKFKQTGMNAIQNIYGEKSFSPPRRSISGNIDQTELARIQLEKANLQKTVLVLDQTVKALETEISKLQSELNRFQNTNKELKNEILQHSLAALVKPEGSKGKRSCSSYKLEADRLKKYSEDLLGRVQALEKEKSQSINRIFTLEAQLFQLSNQMNKSKPLLFPSLSSLHLNDSVNK